MDALVILLVQLTVQFVLAITRLAMMASILTGQVLAWLLVAAWQAWKRRRYRRRWR